MGIAAAIHQLVVRPTATSSVLWLTKHIDIKGDIGFKKYTILNEKLLLGLLGFSEH